MVPELTAGNVGVKTSNQRLFLIPGATSVLADSPVLAKMRLSKTVHSNNFWRILKC